MLQIILILLSGVLSTAGWSVTNPVSICGVRGSSVTIPCNFTYPKDESLQVKQVSWCNNVSTDFKCDQKGPYAYNSSHNQSSNQINFQYTGNNISDCSLLISNINSTNSGVYLFRFITSLTEGRVTSNGTNVTVTDLNVSMSRLENNGSIMVGHSLNLTCTVSCPSYSPDLQWFKDNEPTEHSGPILTFSSISRKDSGNYSCALKNFKSSESEQIRLDVEDSTFWIMIIGVSIIPIIVIIVLILITCRAKTQGTQKEVKTTKTADNVPQDEEVQYASVSIKPKELTSNTEDQQNEESTIYSAVRVSEVKGNKM